jgi:hypothetical protein
MFDKTVFKRMPQDDDELYLFVQAIWGMTIPRTPVCEHHQTPFQAFADSYFARYPITIWLGSRGFGGKTRTLSLLTLTEAVALAASASILGGSGDQSANVHDAAKEAWDWHNSPKYLLSGDPTKKETKLLNGAKIKALMASQTSVRGGHPQRLRLDEIDEMDIEILDASLGQPMMRKGNPTRTQITMSSTHQYPDGTVTEMLKRAKEKDYPVYRWCWKESSNPVDGWLPQTEVEEKRRVITAAMWETEYDLQEPSIGNRAIDTESVDLAFDKYFTGVERSWPGEENKLLIFEEGRIHGGLKRKWPYFTSVDWAKSKDWSVAFTFDTSVTPWRLVAFQRFGRQQWPVMVAKAEKQYELYGGLFIHDATGLGAVVDDYLSIEKKAIRPVILSGGRARADLFNEYISAIESGDLSFPMIEYVYSEHKFVTNDDLFTSAGHPPDSFIAGAIAWAHRSRRHSYLGVTPDSITKRSGWEGVA